MADKITEDITTNIGTFSFPHIFKETASTNDKGETVFDIQFLIPKSDREGARKVLAAIKKVGLAKWGDNWKSVRTPLRDGDKEASLPTDDGSTRGEKYPERLGHYFINARSSKPVGVYDRQRNIILNSDEVYAGCKGKVAVTFYPYNTNGNVGIGCGLNGVQKVADGEAIGGGGKPSVESMFDMLDEDDDLGLDEDEAVEETPAPVAKKAAPAKKAAAKKATAKKAAPVEVESLDDDDLGDEDADVDDLYDDLEDAG